MSGDPHAFYTERIPMQFNRALEEQLENGGAEDRVYRGLASVTETLAIVVDAGGNAGDAFFLNVREGRMSAGAEPEQAPFLTLVHDLAAFEVLEREAGDSALGFLGGMAGLAGEIKLTRQRIENLRMIRGAIRFTLTGDDGFTILTHFGPDPVPDEPQCSISVDSAAYAQLRAGEIDAQAAFMSGSIDVLGDMQMAMQLALAVLSPD